MKKLLLLLATALTGVMAYAQPQYYNSNNSTATTTFPFFQNPTGNNRLQTIMQNSYFPLAASGNITAIYFRASNTVGGSYTLTNLNINMGSTTINNYPTTSPLNYTSGLTNVYTGSTTVTVLAGGWIKIILQHAFAYDNTKNIVVDVSVQNSVGLNTYYRSATGFNSPVLYGNYASSSPVGTTSIISDFGFDCSTAPLAKTYNNAAFGFVTGPTPGFCPNVQNMSVIVSNRGFNRLNSVTMGWTLDGVKQPDLVYNNLIDTFTVTGTGYATISGFATVDFSKGLPRTLKFWTSMPNGVADTVTWNDTQTVVLTPVSPVQITPSGYTSICPGGAVNVQLTPTAGATSTYLWRYVNGSINQVVQISTTATPYTATLFGTYTVTATLGGCTSTSTVKIDSFIMPKPHIMPMHPVVCTGDSTMLTLDTTIAGASYQWKFRGADIGGAIDTTYYVKSGGGFSVWVSKYGCADSSDSVHVVEKPVPVPTITDVTHYLVTDTTAMVSYQWYMNTDTTPVAITGATGSTYLPNKAGDYFVIVFNGGCYGTSHPYHVDSMAAAVYDKYAAEHIKIYPNPAKNQFYVDAPNNARISVAGMDGRLLMQQMLNNSPVDISTLSEGVYIIRVMDKNNVVLKTEKLIKSGL